ncbi:MAG: RidA family protein [Desulfobacteria bacterium]
MGKNQRIDPGWNKYGNHPELTYASAVRRGNMLFISGITGVNPDTGELVSTTDMVAQTRQIYRNIGDVLKATGATAENVVQTTDYITTRENYKQTAEVRREFFGDSFPSSVGFVVKELLRKDALIEVSVVAVLD